MFMCMLFVAKPQHTTTVERITNEKKIAAVKKLGRTDSYRKNRSAQMNKETVAVKK